MTMESNVSKAILVNILLLTTVLSIPTEIRCPSGSHQQCDCFAERITNFIEFQCPSKNPKTVTHVKPNDSVMVDCYSNEINYEDSEIYPNITAGKIRLLTIKLCPIPLHNFQPLFDGMKISRENLKVFKMQNSNNSFSSISNFTREHLAGLESLEEVLFLNNYLTMADDFVEGLPNLTELDMNHNNLGSLNFNVNKNPKLTRLELVSNNISSIPTGWFRHSNKLRVLQLWNNMLTELSGDTFEGLHELRLLELSSNRIRHVDDTTFSQMPDLQELNLSNNLLNYLPPNIFMNNSQLKNIRLGRQPHLVLDNFLFGNLVKLTTVQLHEAHLTSIPEHLFENCTNLKEIKLQKNDLKELPVELFKGLTKLEKLYLQNNQFQSLEVSIFKDLTKLTILDLSYNNLTVLGPKLFHFLGSLLQLNLRGNKIETIDNHAFINLNKLTTLDLSHNKINSSSYESYRHPFTGILTLEHLDLSYNLIENPMIEIVQIFVRLKMFNLSHNAIEQFEMIYATPVSSKLYMDLSFNNITSLDNVYPIEELSTFTINIANNPIICDCTNYELFTYYKYLQSNLTSQLKFEPKNHLKCFGPTQFKNQYLDQLKPEQFTCAWMSDCPTDCSCSYRPYDTARVVDCSYRNFHFAPVINVKKNPTVNWKYNQTELHLEGNMLEQAPTADIIGYENVTKLFLENNEIKTIEWVPPEISILHLDYNNIEELSSDFLNTLTNSSSLRNLTLANNPWKCDCDAVELQGFLRQNYLQVDSTKIQCKNSKEYLINQDICPSPNSLVLGFVITLLCIMFAIAAASAVYFYYRHEIKVWLYAKNLCLWFVTEEELDKDKTYDIFLSYSHKDEQFVEQKLLHELESGSRPYKVCLHVRDFTPGEFIATQVIRSVQDSRRTLVILSNNFVESVWGQMEFKAAHSQAMKDGRARVVVVIYGELNEEKLDPDLKAYLKTNTYVKWGEPYFWNKLHYALPHRKGKFRNQHQRKLEQVMLKIDDKFDLVSSSQGITNSTPPVVLDVSLLKSHPLSLNPGVYHTPPAEAGTGRLLGTTVM